jgi:hypothetical protein
MCAAEDEERQHSTKTRSTWDRTRSAVTIFIGDIAHLRMQLKMQCSLSQPCHPADTANVVVFLLMQLTLLLLVLEFFILKSTSRTLHIILLNFLFHSTIFIVLSTWYTEANKTGLALFFFFVYAGGLNLRPQAC